MNVRALREAMEGGGGGDVGAGEIELDEAMLRSVDSTLVNCRRE